jgi:tellurite resistance protein TehA-like permease
VTSAGISRGLTARASLVLARLRRGIAGLLPGYFALVMATGIVSAAVGESGAAGLSGTLLGIAIGGYLVLVAAYGWRLAGYRREFLADAADPSRAFGYFTFVAGSNVLGARLAADGHRLAAACLLVAAGLGWLLLSYGLPLLLITGRGTGPALAGINGTWFLWAVGTQSIAVSLAVLATPAAAGAASSAGGGLAAAAVGFWAVGVVLYLLIAGLALAGLLGLPVDPARLTPAYWVFMGATAISVLAGAQVLRLPGGPLVTAVRPVVAGLSVALWAFGTWLIPLLIGLGAWRHLVRRVPLRYEPPLWSMVFPLGMYSVASRALGTVLRVPWLVTVGAGGTWVAFGAWVLVFAGMLASLAGWSPGLAVRQAGGGNDRW